MARTPTHSKAHRALDLLVGLETPEVTAALAPFGLDAAVLDTGWVLLRAYGRTRPSPDLWFSDDCMPRLAAWESRWLPILDASLRHRFPDAHDMLLKELPRARGTGRVLTLAALLERFRTLEKDPSDRTKKALALLRKRGLRSATFQQLDAILQEMRELAPLPRIPRRTAASARRAEDKLWAWYLEWSQIARTTLRDSPLLGVLGFSRPGRPRRRTARTEDAEGA